MINRVVGLFRVLKLNAFRSNARSGWGGDEVLKRLISTIVLGLVAILGFGISSTQFPAFQMVATGLMLAGAASVSGAFLGFLFGIPRTSQTDEEKPDSGSAKNVTRSYKPNTNLEQISDWLTKILVGVGLTQIGSISGWFHNLVAFFAPYLGSNPAIVGCIILYFLVCGFMMGFLWSRLYMAGAIQKAESEILKAEIFEEVKAKVDQKEESDAKAVAAVNQLLDFDAGVTSISQEEINKLLNAASPVVKVMVFDQAKNFRQHNWKDEKNKRKVSRVIPVFRALIACDHNGTYHRNYGQLGYALKDQAIPDYRAADAAFTQAIVIRDRQGKKGKWLLYEFNRAFCRIKINQLERQDVFPKETIFHDIRTASQSQQIKEIFQREQLFETWLQEAGLTVFN